MATISIACPICSSKGKIEISEEMVQSKSTGLLTINIRKDYTCEHAYVAYIDKNFAVRDYFNLDYNIELPKVQVKEKEESDPFFDVIRNYDLDLIKLNITANILSFMLKSIFMKKSIVFLKDGYVYNDFIVPFFQIVNYEAFSPDISLLSEEELKKSKNQYKNHIVVTNSGIIRNPFKFINIKNIKVEKQIFNTFFIQSEILAGLQVINHHVKKSYDLATFIKDYVQDHKDAKHIYAKELTDYLEQTHSSIVSTHYLDYLIEIVNNYFEIPVKLSMPLYSGVF
jgi:hypothetical protein